MIDMIPKGELINYFYPKIFTLMLNFDVSFVQLETKICRAFFQVNLNCFTKIKDKLVTLKPKVYTI